MFRTIVKEIELAREGIDVKHSNATLFERKTHREAELEEDLAVKGLIRGQVARAERRMTALKAYLDEAQLALEKLTGRLSRAEANLQA